MQRHHRAVDARAAAPVAEARVHGVREIDRRRAHRQIDDLALRRQHVDGVGEEAALERGEPLGRVGDRVLPVEHLPQPRDAVLERGVAARALLRAFLVAPVRGDAVFGMLVHLARADLHLERLALRADHRRVQRAIVVGLRLRDVIVELARRAASTDDGRCRARRSSPSRRRPGCAPRGCRTGGRCPSPCAASCARCCRCASAGR